MDATMPDRGLPLSLWGIWWNAILLLRPAFSRLRTFMWFVTAVAGLTVRVELLGVTSIVRALNLRPGLYTKLLDHFHSSGVKLDRLSALWAQAVLQLFPGLVSVNGRLVLVGDGIKAPKRGKKMPAVKLLHQQSESNTKPEYIMGHSMQAVGLLVHAANSVFSVPLAVRIHEGLAHPARQDARLARHPGYQGSLLLCRRCLLRRRQDGERLARSGQPSGDPGQIQCGGLCSRSAQERQDKGAAQALWQEDKAEDSARGQQINATGRQSGLWRAQRHSALSRLRSVVASGGPARALRGRHSPHQGSLHPDVHRYVAERRRHHPSLRLAFQDRAQLQASHAPDRLIRLPFLDEGHDPVALPQRQSIPPSQIGRLPKPCQTQNARLSCLHPGRRRRPGTSPVSRCRRPEARLGLFRVLAANHSSRHPAIGVGRGRSTAPDTSRFSPDSLKKQFSLEIHRRAAGCAKYADLPLGFVIKTLDS